MVNRKWLVLLLALAASVESSAAAQKLAKHQQREQTSFGSDVLPGETRMQKPVDIPEDALQVLRNTQKVFSCFKPGEATPHRVPALWFVGSEIHLNGSNEVGLIAQPRDLPETPPANGCLYGAHASPFWVLGNADGKYRLLLETIVDALQISDSRTNGYRDIEVWSLTAVTRTTLVFRFDGHQYRLAEKKTEP